jgi:twinkle protein
VFWKWLRIPVKQRRASKMAEGSTLVRHESCPQCGSKDNLARYSDGHGWCFGCSSFHPAPNTEGKGRGEVLQFNGAKHKAMEMTGTTAAIPERRISEETCRKYGVTVEFEGSKIIKHHYPFKDLSTGATVASKVRVVEGKKFYSTGDTAGKLGLFGQDTCKGNGKFITITEGELDCLSVSEMFDRKYDVVSLRNGASSAAKEIKEQLEFLESYETVVLCFDNDTAGLGAVVAVRDIFSPNKLKVCKLPLKDAGDMLVANRIRDFTAAWWDAKVYTPQGIVNANETWQAVLDYKNTPSVPYPWSGLEEMLRGQRKGELNIWAAETGVGKSQCMRELIHSITSTTKQKVGCLMLEESVAKSMLGWMSFYAGKPLHKQLGSISEEELWEYWLRASAGNRFILLDHKGWGNDIETLKSRIRFMSKALGCETIILDHLHIALSSIAGASGDWSGIDELVTQLTVLAQECGICLHLVSHVSEGRALRGSKGIAKLADAVIFLERDKHAADEYTSNTTTVVIDKNRFCGETGIACYLYYDKETGRMSEVAKPIEVVDNDF